MLKSMNFSCCPYSFFEFFFWVLCNFEYRFLDFCCDKCELQGLNQIIIESCNCSQLAYAFTKNNKTNKGVSLQGLQSTCIFSVEEALKTYTRNNKTNKAFSLQGLNQIIMKVSHLRLIQETKKPIKASAFNAYAACTNMLEVVAVFDQACVSKSS